MGECKWHSVHLLGQLTLSGDVCEGFFPRDDLEDNLGGGKTNSIKVKKKKNRSELHVGIILSSEN